MRKPRSLLPSAGAPCLLEIWPWREGEVAAWRQRGGITAASGLTRGRWVLSQLRARSPRFIMVRVRPAHVTSGISRKWEVHGRERAMYLRDASVAGTSHRVRPQLCGRFAAETFRAVKVQVCGSVCVLTMC